MEFEPRVQGVSCAPPRDPPEDTEPKVTTWSVTVPIRPRAEWVSLALPDGFKFHCSPGSLCGTINPKCFSPPEESSVKSNIYEQDLDGEGAYMYQGKW